MKLYSDIHRDLYRQHYVGKTPATRPNEWLENIEIIADRFGAEDILDYGCGIARGISRFSRYPVRDYDPGVVGCDGAPKPADLVVSVHALEHVEPDYVGDVVKHMVSLSRVATLIIVSCEPSTKTLPDGSPWHCFVRDRDWWMGFLNDFTPIKTVKEEGREYAALRAMV